MSQRKIKLNFHGNSAGTHPQAWREPYGRGPGEFGVGYYQELARIAERGLFDAFFFADVLGLSEGRQRLPMFDPLVILTAIAAVTERIGLVGSASTTFRAAGSRLPAIARLQVMEAGNREPSSSPNAITSIAKEQRLPLSCSAATASMPSMIPSGPS